VKIALLAGIVAAAVGSGSALATHAAVQHGPPRPQHRPTAHHPVPPGAHSSHHPLSAATVQAMIAAWSAAHPGSTNPAQMTQAELAKAAAFQPGVYAPGLSSSSKAVRLIQRYGAWATLSPKLRALERAQGIPIPADIPYVPPSEYIPAARLARLKAALAAARRP
jgi:hypothetical protein